jgi:hypothetical protein
MTELNPCPACKRHVRGSLCPFCGATTARREPVQLGAGRVSRAFVFASATLAATACAHRQKGVDEQGEERVGGPCIPPDEERIKQLEAQKAEVDKQPDSDDKNAQEHALDEELQRARMPNCAPYGAPPARSLIA